jgi:hypothetical protein
VALVVLPTFAEIWHWRYQIDLDGDGRRFTVEMHFNPRDRTAGTDGAWYMDLLDAAGVALVRGVKLTVGEDKLHRYAYRSGMPSGKLHVRKSQGDTEAGSTDLGRTVLPLWERPE